MASRGGRGEDRHGQGEGSGPGKLEESGRMRGEKGETYRKIRRILGEKEDKMGLRYSRVGSLATEVNTTFGNYRL